MPKYSFIVPVYNRPQEVDELLDSMLCQTDRDFEVVVVEDGSAIDCQHIVEAKKEHLDIAYHKIENSGPGPARNYGAANSSGEWLIFLDSDTLLPKNYLDEVARHLSENTLDAFGGADKDREDFLPIQRAISYSMTSFLTTGGIRGSEKSLEKFKPRSFNMGIRKEVFEGLDGFRSIRYGEDIDFSLRIEKANYKTGFIPKAFVYHKRRTSYKAFFDQIRHSGEARILLSKLHKGSFKLVHLFPSLFIVGLFASVFLTLAFPKFGLPLFALYVIYIFTIAIDASFKSRSLIVGILAISTSFIQLVAYGVGFVKAGTIFLIKG